MKWLYPVVGLTALVSATPSAAQTQTASQSGPVVSQWYAGGSTGIAAVEKVGALVSAEAGVRVLPNFDVSLEFGWFQNTTTSSRSGLANTLATFLEQTQGRPATGSVSVPTTYGSVNARYVFENKRSWRPYAVLGVGGARVSANSTFTSGGTDISGSLPQYGVTLGLDLSGHRSHPAFTGGGGVLIPLGKWYADAGVRVTTIRTPDQATNVARLNIGMGARF